jgi:hypothetical protein
MKFGAYTSTPGFDQGQGVGQIKPGDVIEIEGIGVLTNTVAATQ